MLGKKAERVAHVRAVTGSAFHLKCFAMERFRRKGVGLWERR